jgi:hypothetical protein
MELYVFNNALTHLSVTPWFLENDTLLINNVTNIVHWIRCSNTIYIQPVQSRPILVLLRLSMGGAD